ncbi:MAG: HU family DNA-binding protein [Salinivirgaceae bacterium]|nr:HU family DNA-binding protein [Salinivirgaceae bacterium]
MNKQELVAAMAEKAGLTKADAEKALNAFVETTKQTLGKKESIQLVGFGTFSVSERAQRTGRNPQTGKEITIAAKSVAKFKAGKALDEQVNNK